MKKYFSYLLFVLAVFGIVFFVVSVFVPLVVTLCLAKYFSYFYLFLLLVYIPLLPVYIIVGEYICKWYKSLPDDISCDIKYKL